MIAVLVLVLGLIGGLAGNLVHSQRAARAELDRALHKRAAVAAQLTASALRASQGAEQTYFGGPERGLRQKMRLYQGGDPSPETFVVDAHGRTLVAYPTEATADRADVRHAVRGEPVISDLIRLDDALYVRVVRPFETRYGRRALIDVTPADVLQEFARGYLASALAVDGGRAYLLDGHGRVLAGTTKERLGQLLADRSLAAILGRAAQGAAAGLHFTSAPVRGTHWRVVFVAPQRVLYASNGSTTRAAWILFGAFVLALLALVSLGVTALRRSSQLAGARERERAATTLAYERLHDALTGLPNRALFLDRAERALRAAARDRRALAVLFVDLDRFKRVNDSLGHATGDALLCGVAERLQSVARGADTVSRLGGDEFLVLAEGLTHADDALRLAVRLQDALCAPFTIAGRELSISCSIGVVVHTPNAVPADAAGLVHDADVAMYRAKQQGHGRVELFDAEMQRSAVLRLDTEEALRAAIPAGELRLDYQPLVSLPDGTVSGVEALVRWARPGHGIVAPMDFIPLAEECGLIGAIGDCVLRTAVADADDWARQGLIGDGFVVSVNVSARQLAEADLVERVAEHVASWALPPSSLCLEITESAVIEEPEAALAVLGEISALGVRLAIDDFGAGYSSLGQVARSLPVDVLKLDRSFVHGMASERERAIVAAAGALAQALHLDAVAEGVETAEQAADVSTLGYAFGQGYFFGRPMCATAVENRLRTELSADDRELRAA